MSIKIAPTAGGASLKQELFAMKNAFGLYTLEIAGGLVKDKHKHKRKTSVKIKCILRWQLCKLFC